MPRDFAVSSQRARLGRTRVPSAASSVGASGLAALAYVVVVSTFFGYGSWYWLMSRYPASTVAPFTLLVPVVGILTAWLVRGEHPTWGELLGSLVVLVGLGLALGARLRAGGERPAPDLRVDVKPHYERARDSTAGQG